MASAKTNIAMHTGAPEGLASSLVDERSDTAVGSRRIKGFASMRFGADQVHTHEAEALKLELAKYDIDLFVAAPSAGEDISTVVFTAIEQSEFFIALATSTCATHRCRC